MVMPPKKKVKLFDKKSDDVDGIPYTVYEDGVLKVGTTSDRVTVRLKAGDDVRCRGCGAQSSRTA